MTELATAYVSLVVETKDLAKGVAKEFGGVEKEAEKTGKSAGGKMGKALAGGLAAAAAGAVLAGKALYNIGATFDDVSDTIRVGTGATGEALASLESSAKNIGKNVPAAFADIGTTVADVNTRLGLTGPTLEKLSSQILEAGRIMGDEIDVNTLSASFNAFKIEGEETTGAMDHLFRVSQATGIGMNELAAAVSSNAPAVQALGFSFEETAAVVGNLDKAGLDSSKMMAAMSRGLVELAKDGEDPQESFKRVTGEIQGFIESGDKAAAIELASKLFGTRNASQFIGALESGALAMDDLSAVAGMTSDTILGASEDTMDFAEQWQIFKNKALVAIEPIATRVFNVITDGMSWINDNAVPAIEQFVQGWKDGEGAGGRFRDIVEAVGDKVEALVGWLKDNEQTVKLIASAVGGAAVGWGLYTVATKAWSTATKIATAVQKGLNAVMKANPIGLIITAIMALVGVLIYLYNNNETVKNAIDKAWAFIKNAIDVVVKWFKNTAWPWLRDAFQKISEKAQEVYEKYIKPAWDGIKSGISTVVDWLRNTAWPWLRDAFQKIGDKAKELYEKYIKPAWEGIKSGISTVVDWLRNTAWPFIKGVWENISSGANTMWDGVKKVFGWLKDGVATVRDAFGKAKDAIGKAWSGLKDAVSAPIKAALSWISSNFIDPLNRLLEKVGLDFRLPTFSAGGAVGTSSSGGPMMVFAAGGRVPGYSPTATADNIPAWLTAGEYVLPVNATKRLMSQVGSPGMEMLRRGQVPGYALGGLIDAGKAGLSWIKKKGTDVIDLASQAWKVISNPKQALEDFVTRVLRGIGDSPLVQTAAQVARKVAGGVASKIADWAGFGGGGDRGGNNMGWQAMQAWFESAFPGMKITSGNRPGARSVTGIVSDHALGRAIDMPPSMEIFNAIDRTWGNIRQLLYSPAGARQIRGGRRSDTSGALRDQHWDHVHWAMKDGGLVKPFVADAGVTLAPGLNLLNNKLGRPEPLARTDTLSGLRIEGTLNTPFGPAEIRGVVRSEIAGVLA